MYAYLTYLISFIKLTSIYNWSLKTYQCKKYTPILMIVKKYNLKKDRTFIEKPLTWDIGRCIRLYRCSCWQYNVWRRMRCQYGLGTNIGICWKIKLNNINITCGNPVPCRKMHTHHSLACTQRWHSVPLGCWYPSSVAVTVGKDAIV